MENISHKAWPEIVFGSSDSAYSQSIHRAIRVGQLRRLAPRMYTSNLTDAPETIVQRNCYHILNELFPGAVLSHRTALEGGLSAGQIVLSYKYTKKLVLPGLIIRLLRGAPAQAGDTPFMGKLFLASRPRALLENMQISRGEISQRKTLPRATVEAILDKMIRIQGVDALNQVRDEARALAKTLQMQSEFKKLDQLIGALLGTRTATDLKTDVAVARAKGLPYDSQRIELFAKVASALQHAILPSLESSATTQTAVTNLGFFEAYFSNFIEGTQFEIDEAEAIIFQHKIIKNRSDDAHDILGTYRIVSDRTEMQEIPESPQQMISLLKSRHSTLLSSRLDMSPGEFKQKQNRAGNTVFVAPDLVEGTLHKGFDFYQQLEHGLARAMFMMFFIAEIHPFMDGNGRIARIMMNAELDAKNLTRIIIPIVYREDYLLVLRRLSRQAEPEAYLTMLQRAQAFTASIDFSDYQKALAQLYKANAFLEPDSGKLTF